MAAVVDGHVVFSDETVWDPYHKPDPHYHFDGIMDSLRKAAAHLPRVDAIGGSAAGVYVNNRVKAGSLFRGVPQDLFDARVKDLFLDLRKAWDDVPFEVVNDGEVTALAGSMSLGENAVLGIALGTSTAAGYVTPDGNITSWLNELAFVPIDYNPDAPVDEWSGDYGVGSQYFSQQAVGRLMPAAGIDAPADMASARATEDRAGAHAPRATRAPGRSTRRIGTYLGYGVAHFADFYDLRARAGSRPRDVRRRAATSSSTARARCSRPSFPSWRARIAFHVPDEKDKRHGQAIAAASLPAVADERRHDSLPPLRRRARAARARRQAVPARWLPDAGASAAAGRCAARADLLAAPRRRVHHRRARRCGSSAKRACASSTSRSRRAATRRARQARWDELRGACDYLGFELVATVPGGLEKINAADAQRRSGALAARRST